MLKLYRSSILPIRNRNGQVALFVALIFQVLFLFFAMVINVGLLVHHKINLQNSVDLAAYYGAGKQAENLNALSHMNYQIRQSWKLLSWRYRMLGSAGAFEQHPYNKETKTLNESLALESVASTEPGAGYQEAPAFCITYIPFKPMPPGENTCKNMASLSGIKLFQTPRVFGFLAISAQMAAMSTMLKENALKRCRDFGSYNYVMLGKFIVAFNTDQRDRMTVLNELSRTMSNSTDDFYDLDGDSVKVGIENTFNNNLTAPNREHITKFKIYNSLGDPKCGTTSDKNRPVKWLSPIKIYPGFSYIDTTCENNGPAGGSITPSGKELSGDPSSYPHYYDQTVFKGDIENLAQFIGYRSNLTDTYNFSLGVEKNPWCMAYVGVSAETQPSIPFSPFGSIKLKARAFVKPFGGRIGPWYKSTWSRRDMDNQSSDGGSSVDALIPPRVTDISSLAGTMADEQNKRLRAANYSRYVGDPIGLKSAKMIGYYGKSIYELDPTWKTYQTPPAATTGLYPGDSAPNFNDWDDLPFKYNQNNGSGDILAWDQASQQPSRMRSLELSAVAPNTFDIAYYSIDADFYHNYYTRMKKGFIQKVGNSVAANFRPDIGYHKGYKNGAFNLDEYSVKDQISEVSAKDSELILPPKETLPFSVAFSKDSWAHLLTGWGSVSLSDYSLNPGTFGKCSAEPEAGVPNPGGCVVGGSTGYSVKIISSDYLNSDLQLGGENTPKGAILNPPPSDF